mmetsp:Transcript_30123/g.79603  ORF Transcript_30123/g.79603 Transcript_30123/m.79603 type:complete len:148 (+) Transcript_30123:267-710(+)
MIGKLLTLWCILASVVTEGGCFVVHRGTYTVSAQRCYWRRGSQLRKEQKSAVREGGCKVYGEPKQQAKQDTNFAQDYSFANLDHIKLVSRLSIRQMELFEKLETTLTHKDNDFESAKRVSRSDFDSAGRMLNQQAVLGGRQARRGAS